MTSLRRRARAGAVVACSTLVLTTASTLTAAAAAGERPATPDSPAAGLPTVELPAAESPVVESPAGEPPITAVVGAPPVRAGVPAPLPNRAPVANDDRMIVVQGGSATIDLFANDSDPDGDALSLVGGTSAGHGTVSFAGGAATYTADSDFAGDDTFVYVIGDAAGATASATVRVTITPARQAVVPPAPERATPRPAPAAVAPVRTQPAAAPAVTVQSAPTRQTARAVRSSAPRTTTVAAMGPSTTPYVAPAARPATLPFTGGTTDALLPLGLGLLLGGGLLVACVRPRRDCKAMTKQLVAV